jgi:glyoxylase-like metal-dependent hydrolase (beta-lactamase superfamily II)
MKDGRRVLTLVLLVVFSAVATTGSGEETQTSKPQRIGPPSFETVEVSDSVVMARHDHGANITCIALENGLYFIDVGLSTPLAAEFRRQMEKRFSATTAGLILTHLHIDHYLGMGAFSDVPVLAAEAGRDLLDRQLAYDWDERSIAAYASVFPTFAEDLAVSEPFAPSIWIHDEIVVGPPGKGLLFRNTGGHSSCSSFVYFEAEGVLVSGDLVQAHRRPYFGDVSNDLPVWIDTLKEWHLMKVNAVCPGHGPTVDRDYLKLTWTYFEQLTAAIKELKAGGVSVQDSVSHESLPTGYWPDDGTPPGWWPMCIARLYKSL